MDASDPLVHLPTLACIVRTGSYSAAADVLGVNRSAVTKRIQRMEAALGVPVLARTTRRVAPTMAGKALLDRHQEAQATLVQGLDEARSAMAALTGRVRVACAGSSLAVHLVAPALLTFSARHPTVRVDLHAPLAGESGEPADLELRLTDAPPLDRSARPLARVSWAFHASDAYLAKHDRPVHPSDLVDHCLVVPEAFDRPATFKHQTTAETVTLKPGFGLTSNIQEVAFEMVKRGEAISLLPNYLWGSAPAGVSLVALLPQWRLQRMPAQTLYAIHPQARYQRALTRAVVDHLHGVCVALPGA